MVGLNKDEQTNRLIEVLRHRKPVDLSKDKNIKWIDNAGTKKT